ncbi:MAG: S8 family serine peptidase [Silvanigrellaceae bacterium]
MNRAIASFVMSAFLVPSCIKKSPLVESFPESVAYPESAEEILNLDASTLTDVVAAEALANSFPVDSKAPQMVELSLLVRDDWQSLAPLKLKSGDVRKFSDKIVAEDVVAIGDVPVKKFKPSPHHIKNLRRLYQKLGKSDPLFDVVKVEVGAENVEDLIKTLNKLNSMPGVLFSEPNGKIKVIAATERKSIPNDIRWPELWNLQTIEMPFAWNHGTGTGKHVVAVIDSGVELTHEDLRESLWTNPGELPGNGIDDDGNGYVDDVNGWNHVDNNNLVTDINGHGTHCAGILGARGNNRTGITGVAWNAKIMPVKIINDAGMGDWNLAYDGVVYAISNGARILSNSYASPSTTALMATAIQLAHTTQTLFVASAGNSSVARAEYPAYFSKTFDNVISVASTTGSGLLSGFSNYGDGVDIAAPGSGILSTFPGNSYKLLSGTSMAAPHVAGAAAVLWDSFPRKTMHEIRNSILNGAAYLANLKDKIEGSRQLNVDGARAQLDGSVPPGPQPPPPSKKGLRYSFFEGNWKSLPNFSSLAAKSSGTTANLNLNMASAKKNFGIVFEGFVKIDQPGQYTFVLKSDDGSKLYLNDEPLINLDGVHTAKEKSASIKLERGFTKIRLEYFQDEKKKTLKLSWKGPGHKKENINSSGRLYY